MGTDAPRDRRQVILLAGPSGSGKSTIVRAAGLPILYLDDFYRAGSDPDLPRDPELGIVDWDHPDSWDRQGALAALEALCSTGSASVPIYDIAAILTSIQSLLNDPNPNSPVRTPSTSGEGPAH
mgnify:CR=1 FL=1